jgi:general L-amino acid transport system permease protein
MMAELMMRPPKISIGPVAWMRQHLFSSWYNSLLTLVVGYLVVTSVGPLFSWLFFDANFRGTEPSQCDGGGAC